MLDKIIALFRNTAAIPTAPAGIADGEPMIPACDNAGIIWTRLTAGGNAITSGTIATDAIPTTETGEDVRSFIYGFNSVTWDRLRTLADNGDAQAALTLGLLATMARLEGFNGATYDRLRTASTALAGTQPKVGVMAVERSGDWSISHIPPPNVIATVTRPAVANVKHVCSSITAVLSDNGAAATLVSVLLRDGASGIGPVLWGQQLINNTGIPSIINLSNLAIVGSVNTAMTLEFNVASGINTYESVSMTGYDL